MSIVYTEHSDWSDSIHTKDIDPHRRAAHTHIHSPLLSAFILFFWHPVTAQAVDAITDTFDIAGVSTLYVHMWTTQSNKKMMMIRHGEISLIVVEDFLYDRKLSFLA